MATCEATAVTPNGQGSWRVGWPPGAGGMGVPPATRYQYKGGWSYESGAWGPGPGGQGAVGGPLALWGENPDLPPVTLQYVGWRWYQPSIGRFVQRDPIGLDGGLNVYLYCDADPVVEWDADGLGPWPTNYIPKRFPKKVHDEATRLGLAAWLKQLSNKDPRIWKKLKKLLKKTPKGPPIVCIIMLGPAAGEALADYTAPYVEEARSGYSDWTLGGRGGLPPPKDGGFIF